MSHNKLHCCRYTCPECHISAPGHTLGNCMGPPRSPSHVTSPTGWTLSLDEPTSPPPRYHPYCLRGCPQGIRVKKSQGTSPHPQPCVFSPVNSLDLYDPSSRPLFSPGRNLSPSRNIIEPILPPVTMTPPSSPLSAPDSLPPTLWSPEDPVCPSWAVLASQLTAGPSQTDSPLGHKSTTMNNNIYGELPLTHWTSWTASMSNNISAVSLWL